MAIRYRKDRQKWQIYWKNPWTGKIQSTFRSTKHEAQAEDSMVKHRLRFDRESFRPKEPVEELSQDDSLEAIYYAYLREKQFSRSSLDWHLKSMRLPLSMIGRKRMNAISRQDLAAVLRKHTESSVKPVTVRGRMRVLLTVMRWSLRRGYVDVLPQFPELPPAAYEVAVPPTPEEAIQIIGHASEHVQRVVVLGAKLGIRIGPSEMFRLQWEAVDLARGVVRVPAAKKNLREPWREVPIKDSLIGVFRVWQEADAKLGIPWVIHWKGKQVKSISTAWAATLRRAGISRRIRPYDLRHAFATDAIAAGADVGTIARLMGHASPIMVLTHYQHVLTRAKKNAVEALHRGGDHFGTQGISASRGNPFVRRMVSVGFAQESAAGILGQIDRF